MDPVDNPVSLLNDVTNKGYETNVTGSVTKNLSVIASYTYMKYRDQFGRRARNVPDKFGDVMLNYQSTSYHDALAVRRILNLRPAPEFLAWLQEKGIYRDTEPALLDAPRRQLMQGLEASLARIV